MCNLPNNCTMLIPKFQKKAVASQIFVTNLTFVTVPYFFIIRGDTYMTSTLRGVGGGWRGLDKNEILSDKLKSSLEACFL